MLLRLAPKKSRLNLIIVIGLHCAAGAAACLSAAPLPVQLVLLVAVGLSGAKSLFILRSSNVISSLHFQEQGAKICVGDGHWLPVTLTVKRCDRFLILLQMDCLDVQSEFYPHHWLLWIYPGVVSARDRRRLRRFIRWHWAGSTQLKTVS